MPFIHRSQIDPKTRAEQLDKYCKELKAQLLNPSLTQHQRVQIKKKINQVNGYPAPSFPPSKPIL